MRLRLLGGLVLFVSTLYCGPARRTGKGRGKEGAGLYPQLAVLGFGEGQSAALSGLVARQCALLGSFEQAAAELADRGLPLRLKAVHRIACRLGAQVLTARTRDLLAWRAGQLPAGTELAGRRVACAVDGGRTRLRKLTRKQKGKGKHKKQKRRYKAQWKEPKLLIIYELDDKGNKKRGGGVWVDGTFGGPDEAMELLAMHLHRLGAARACEVAFCADGAPWVWERLAWVVKRVGLDPERVVEVLDFCHAVAQMGQALDFLKLEAGGRLRLLKKLRKWLRQGRGGLAVHELDRLGAAAGALEGMEVHLSYLEKHLQKGRLRYDEFRRKGLPCGSGAVESAIRRVINLRLKGPGQMWHKDNAEAMLLLRACALTGRWEETLQRARDSMALDRRLDWHWRAPDMLFELQSGKAVAPPSPQAQAA